MSTITRRAIPMPPVAAKALIAAGGLATAASTLIHWTYTTEFPGDLTVDGYPGGLQILTLVAGLLTAAFALPLYGVKGTRWLSPAGPEAAALILAVAGFATTWFTVLAISVELGGIANLEPGGAIAALASLIPLIGALGLPQQSSDTPAPETRNPLVTARHLLGSLGRLIGPARTCGPHRRRTAGSRY